MLSSLNVDGDAVSESDSYTFENVTSNHTITATFEEIPENTLRLIDKNTILQVAKYGMDTVSITNTSDTFNGWSSKGTELGTPKNQSLTVTMPNNNTEITVNHKPTLKLTLDEETVIETEKTSGETVNLSTVIAEGEEFGGWLARGVTISPMQSTQSFIMPDNVSVKHIFQRTVKLA